MKVYVGMSGGVDSSLTAALLKEQGHDVTGVYMKNWTEDLPGMRCPWADDLADAKRVAVQLGIDLKVYDFQDEYKQKVVDYMVEEYSLGRTPNPDIMCNQEVKFKLFLETALEDGAEMIATGHYARVESTPLSLLPSLPIPSESSRRSLDAGPAVESAPSFEKSEISSKAGAESPHEARLRGGPDAPLDVTRLSTASSSQPLATSFPEDSGLPPERGKTNDQLAPSASEEKDGGEMAETAKLLQAKDANKDQTYFLYRITGEALKKTLFPLGGYTKPEVREMAKTRGLYTATKKDSQGICFVGQIGVKEFLSQYVSVEPGDIIDKQSGQVLGRHEGAIFYTLGQRHGLNLGGGLPYYVIGKDMNKNEVYVTRDLNDDTLWRKTVQLGSLHWINEVPQEGEYQVRIRHRAPLISAKLSIQGSEASLELSEPQRAITAGQSVVVYDGNVCLGGGIVGA